MAEAFLNIKCKKQFKDCEYEVKAQVPTHRNCLQFEIKSLTDPWSWRNEFSAQYIEDLTEKTGQKKTFFEFLGLVDECLNQKQGSKSTFDILTYTDLKYMNAKKDDSNKQSQLGSTVTSQMNSNSTATNESNSITQQRQNKRYLIITSNNGAFDEKTHYPLSLNGEQINDPNTLKDIIKHLQKELHKSRHNEDGNSSSNSSTFYSTNGFEKKQQTQGSPRSTSGKSFYDQQGQKTQVNKKEHDQLKVENELLKAKVKRIEDYFSQKQGAIEIEQLIKQKFQLENEIDKMRILSNKKICELELEVEMKERQLTQKKTESLELQKQLTQIVCDSEDTANKRIKAQLLKLSEETEQQLVLSKKTIQKQKQEIDKLQSDAERFVNDEKKLKQKIAQLEIELTNSQRRSNSRSNPLGARGTYGSNNSSHSSFNSRRSTPNNHPTKLGYSSPSLQIQSRNRFNRVDTSLNKASTPQSSKNSLNTPKSQSYTSIRSNSLNSQSGTPNNNRFSRPGLGQQNTVPANQRNNKFFSSNNNPNNNQNGQQNGSLNSSLNSRNSSTSNGSLNRQASNQVQNQTQNKRQPLYSVTNDRQNSQNRNQQNSLNRNQQNSQNNNISINNVKNVKSGSFDPIPENGKYNQQKQNTQSSPSSAINRLYQPKTQYNPPQAVQRTSSAQRQGNAVSSRLNQSGNNAQQLRIDSSSNRKSTNPTISTPQSNQSINLSRTQQNPTQPRYVPTNNFMKPQNRNAQPQKVGYQQNQLRSHTQIQEKIDQTLFDDKHILNNQGQQEGKTELEMKIDNLQNILQSAKDMTAEDF